MTEDTGRVLTDRALVCDEAPAGLHPSGFDPSRDTPLRREVVAVINEMSRLMPHATEDWRARLTEALL